MDKTNTQDKAIGIDLGTTYSVVGIVDKHLKIIQNRDAEDLTRSVVGTRKGEIVVGNKAYDYLAKGEPKDIIVSIKRIIGREFSDPSVQKWKKKVKYTIKVPGGATDKSVAVVLGDKEYSPEEISSEILKKLKKDAEDRGYKITKAVITVPAYFNDKQKEATRKAGYMAGLQVLRILPEPTASAISYKVDEIGPGESKTVLVYDLGGGTFDVSLLEITGGTFVELGIGGDMWLGGDDFDDKMMQLVLQKAALKQGLKSAIDLLNTISPEVRFRAEFLLKEKCRKAKEELSSVQETDITIPSWCTDIKGKIIDIEVDIARSEFEKLIEKDIEKSVDIVKEVLKEAQYDIEQIDNILLVGGSSLIPLVKKRLSEQFSESKVLLHTRPMLSVAEGAAILAHRLAQADRIECPHCGKEIKGENEICPHCKKETNVINPPITIYNMSFGIETKDDPFCEIVPRGEYYPAGPFRRTFYTEEKQHTILVPIRQFNHIDNTTSTPGVFWILIPKEKKVAKDTPVEVSMRLDEDGVMGVTAQLLDGSGLVARKTDGGKDQEIMEYVEKINRMYREKDSELNEDEKHQIQDRFVKILGEIANGNIDKAKMIEEEIKNIITKGDGRDVVQDKYNGLVNYSEYMLRRYHALIEPELTYNIQKLVEKLKEYIEEGDQEKSAKIFADLDKTTDEIPGSVRFIDWVARAAWLVEQENPVLANELNSEVEGLINLCKNHKDQEFDKKTAELGPKIQEVYKSKSETSESGKSVGADLLLRSRKADY